jgi:hypothetical protein
MDTKKFLLFLAVVAGLYYLTVTVSAPLRKINQLNSYATNDTVFMSKNSDIVGKKGILPLVKEESYKQAQITLAKQDSISLVINFKDSTALLMLKGVEIHASKIIDFKNDKIFKGINAPAFRKIFSKPLHNITEYSTVIKEPIVVKKAPKDTIEALETMAMPDTIIPEPAYVSFGLEHGFRLILVQENWVSEDEKKTQRKFKSDVRKQIISDNIKSLYTFKEPCYTPTVIIVLNAREVRSIYRALPWNASFVMLL